MKNIETFIPKDTTSLVFELGWDQKENTKVEALKVMVENLMTGSSEHTYDLNLAAILEYTDDKKDYYYGICFVELDVNDSNLKVILDSIDFRPIDTLRDASIEKIKAYIEAVDFARNEYSKYIKE